MQSGECSVWGQVFLMSQFERTRWSKWAHRIKLNCKKKYSDCVVGFKSICVVFGRELRAFCPGGKLWGNERPSDGHSTCLGAEFGVCSCNSRATRFHYRLEWFTVEWLRYSSTRHRYCRVFTLTNWASQNNHLNKTAKKFRVPYPGSTEPAEREMGEWVGSGE